MIPNSHPQVIDTWEDEYKFLSNFYVSEFKFQNETYHSVEHCFQAMKAERGDQRKAIISARTPLMAWRLGRDCEYDEARWDLSKFGIMRGIIARKFWPGSEPAELLLGTNSKLLIYGNELHDQFWGSVWVQDSWLGSNYLGMILIGRRAELQAYQAGWKNNATHIKPKVRKIRKPK